MNTRPLFFFGLVMLGVIFLYNVFPLEDEISVALVEDRDPMLVNTPSIEQDTRVDTPIIDGVDESDEDSLREKEELEHLAKEKELVAQLQKEKKEKELAEKEKKEQERRAKEKAKKDKNKKSPKKEKISKIIKYAKSKLGKRYKQAGTTDAGYDCSGLIMVSNAKYNVKLPRASYEMSKRGRSVRKSDVRAGDLLFFGTKSNIPKRVTHVGMVTEVKGSKIFFIHSSSKSGVILNSLDEGYYRKRLLKIKRHIK